MIFPVPDFADRAIPRAEAARLVGVDATTLTAWAKRNFGPHPVGVGGVTVYDRDQIAVFLAARNL
jgi:hypothetical protein